MRVVGVAVATVMAAVDEKGDPSVYLWSLVNTSYVSALLYLGVFCSAICFLSCQSLTRLSAARDGICKYDKHRFGTRGSDGAA